MNVYSLYECLCSLFLKYGQYWNSGNVFGKENDDNVQSLSYKKYYSVVMDSHSSFVADCDIRSKCPVI